MTGSGTKSKSCPNGGEPTTQTRFIYDGWNLIAELNSSNGFSRKFVWGPDVSGTAQGAGGVGGLLVIDQSSVRYRPIYDGSHNVIGLYGSSGAIVAAYEYDPFGNISASGGTYANSNPFRFSTKYRDNESGLVYYGYRFYDPLLGRFLNRDPIEEAGGLNLYGFCRKDVMSRHVTKVGGFRWLDGWQLVNCRDMTSFRPPRKPGRPLRRG